MKNQKKAILALLLTMITSFSLLSSISHQDPQEWAYVSHLCGKDAEQGSFGEVASETLSATFAGAGVTIIAAGVATGGAAIVAGALWGGIVLG